MSTTTLQLTLALVTCANCGISFGVPKVFEGQRREDHRTFYCPAGHSNYYPGETAEQKRIRQLEADADFYRRRYESSSSEAQSTRRSLAATRGVLTRTKNRIAAGKCPCCRQEFAELADHIAAEHPAYTGKEGGE